VGRTPSSASAPPVAHPALDHRYSLASLTNSATHKIHFKKHGGILIGEQPTGGSAADQGVRPTKHLNPHHFYVVHARYDTSGRRRATVVT
jgi:hypothetical protein